MLRYNFRQSHYSMAVILSSVSLLMGLLREFIIVALLGFTARNDKLQLYLSIFYTIGLSIDAMRLACLNLYAVLPLKRIVTYASMISLPFSIIVGYLMSEAAGDLDALLLWITIGGGYLNLIVAVIITHKQRDHLFLPAQCINILPNVILLPGIVLWYVFSNTHWVMTIVVLTSSIPITQCLLLSLLPKTKTVACETMAWRPALMVFMRHFFAMSGEQWYQIIIRAAFFKFGTGYLSMYAFIMRLYAAARFILIDSFIGSRLAQWELSRDTVFEKMIQETPISIVLVAMGFLLSCYARQDLLCVATQMTAILLLGFYFSTLVRIIYFKINRQETNTFLVWRFAIFEMLFALLAFILTKQVNYPILSLLWMGYIAKPFTQLLLLRRRYDGLALSLKD